MKLFIILLFVAVSEQLSEEEFFEVSSFKYTENGKQLVYNFRKPVKIYRLLRVEEREIYHYGLTIVIRDSLYGKVHRCELIEINKENEAKNVATYLSQLLKKKVQYVNMKKLMYLLKDCDSVDDLDDENGEGEPAEIIENSDNPFVNGIFLGTKWCGPGDIAHGYHDLGLLHNVDRCCRAHDLCPIKVLKKEERYNLTNTGSHTKSHCLCEEVFYDCLKKDNGWSAKVIGNIYFYVASPEYVIGVPECSAKKMKFIPATKKW